MPQLSDIVIAPPEATETENFSESELKRRVETCLSSRLPGHSTIDIAVVGRTVIFRGDLLSTDEKRVCDECCRDVPGVARVMEKTVVIEKAARDT